MTRSARATIVVAAIAIVVVALTYFDAGWLGFFWDDYLLLRPRPWSELLRVWHGSWDQTGIVPAFYRPLAVWTDTAAFAVFGFNEPALRACALLELAVGSWLIGEFVRRESASVWLGVFTAALYASHPAVSASAGPWWFEQNHRLSVICAGAALLAWQSRRAQTRWLAWWPVHLWILIGSWFKEDVLVLAPLVLLFQWWRARTTADLERPSARFVGQVGAAWAVWLGARWWLLGQIAGEPIGGPLGGWMDRAHHAVRGLWLTFGRVRAMQGEVAGVHQVTTVLLIAVSIAGLVAWRTNASARARVLMGYGLIAGLAFNAPVAVASFATRYHLIAIGAVLFLAGAAIASHDATAGAARRWARRIVVPLTCAALLLCFSLSSRASVNFYRPCTRANLQLDDQLRDWLRRTDAWRDSWILPWLDAKARLCDANAYRRIDAVIPDVLRDVREGRR